MLSGAGKLPRHSGNHVGAQVPSPDCLILRLALNSIAGLSTDIYSAVTSVTEAIRKKKILDPDHGLMAAARALIQMPTQLRRTTALDGAQHAEMLPA